jgi:simple sugar transport system permease protein
VDWTLLLAAGIATGTVLLFAAVGEIFAERSGVLNLGVEGMMLTGAVAGFRRPSRPAMPGWAWHGDAAGGLISVHAVVTIHLRADQVVSGPH